MDMGRFWHDLGWICGGSGGVSGMVVVASGLYLGCRVSDLGWIWYASGSDLKWFGGHLDWIWDGFGVIWDWSGVVLK